MLRIDDARAIASFALASAREAGYAPLTIAIVDMGGEVIYLERSDGAVPLTARVAIGKARTALSARMSSGDAAGLPDEIIAAAQMLYGGDFVTRAGGILIFDADRVIGAVGASGAASEEDERASAEGVRRWREQ